MVMSDPVSPVRLRASCLQQPRPVVLVGGPPPLAKPSAQSLVHRRLQDSGIRPEATAAHSDFHHRVLGLALVSPATEYSEVLTLWSDEEREQWSWFERPHDAYSVQFDSVASAVGAGIPAVGDSY
eukprot:12212987-Alexandrium_andersonii.AAC.1